MARSLYKLMAYKDEYEVARLYTSPEFHAQLRDQFDGDFTLSFHFAPPLLSKLTGRQVKRTFGPWVLPMLRVLARLKFLRGTWWDPFGHTEERRTERALIGEYRDGVRRLLPHLKHDNHDLLVEYAEVPERIRGFGHIKAANVAEARTRFGEIEARLLGPDGPLTVPGGLSTNNRLRCMLDVRAAHELSRTPSTRSPRSTP